MMRRGLLLAACLPMAAAAQGTLDAEDRAARPRTPVLPPKPPLPPLQTEPGDIWSDVRGWQEEQRQRIARGGSALPAAPGATPPKPPTRKPAQRPRPPAKPGSPG